MYSSSMNRLAERGRVVRTKEGFRLPSGKRSGSGKKKGLRTPQVRILAALADALEGQLPVKLLGEAASVAQTHIAGWTFKASAPKRKTRAPRPGRAGAAREDRGSR